MKDKNPVVLISYSHDSKHHQDRVLELSNKLRSQGIDCMLDQYEDSPPEGWPKWMDRAIDNSDFVIVVCTEIYYNRVKGKDKNGKGIKWESTLIYQQLYNAGSNNTKFIPIIFSEGKFEFIPEPLQGSTFYNVDESDSYEALYWRLRGVSKKKPELGKLRELPTKERKTFFVSNLIDQNDWDKANWKNGMAYLSAHGGDIPPIMVLFFENIEYGKKIFNHFIQLVGLEDEDERIRVSIVEGDVPKQENGYFVTIGEHPKATSEVIAQLNESESIEYFATQQRLLRVFVNTESIHLANFKKEVDKFKCYYIAPGQQLKGPAKGVSYEPDFKILKRRIEFRQYADIPNENDPDSILKSEEVLNHKF